MYTLHSKSYFLKKAKKLYQANPKIKGSIEKIFTNLEQNPFTKAVRTHKVIAKYDGKLAMSSFVTKDIRIIWRFSNEKIMVIDLIDIGGQSGNKKVYT